MASSFQSSSVNSFPLAGPFFIFMMAAGSTDARSAPFEKCEALAVYLHVYIYISCENIYMFSQEMKLESHPAARCTTLQQEGRALEAPEGPSDLQALCR